MISKLVPLSNYGIKECCDCKYRFNCPISIYFKSTIPHGDFPNKKRDIYVVSHTYLSSFKEDILNVEDVMWCGTIHTSIVSINNKKGKTLNINKSKVLEKLGYDKSTGDINVG